MNDRSIDAQAILDVLVPGGNANGAGVEYAIRVEYLASALLHPSEPETLSELISVLERIAVSEVGRELLLVLHERARREPLVSLRELARRTAEH